MFRGAAGVLVSALSVACGGHARMGSSDEQAPIVTPAKSLCENDAEPRALLAGASAKPSFVSLDVRGTSLVAAFQYFIEDAGEQDGVVYHLDLETSERDFLAVARGYPRWVAIGGSHAYWIDSTPEPQLVRAPLAGSVTPARVGPASLGTVVVKDHLYYGRDNAALMAQPLDEGTGVVVAHDVSPLELATDGEYVYFTACGRGVKRIHRLGGPVEHVADGYCPISLSVFDGQVFYSDMPSGSATFALMRAPAGGGPPVVFDDRSLEPMAIAADADGIYVGAHDGLYRVRYGADEAERIAAGTPTDVALDEHCVYWGDSSAHDVFVMRKQPLAEF